MKPSKLKLSVIVPSLSVSLQTKLTACSVSACLEGSGLDYEIIIQTPSNVSFDNPKTKFFNEQDSGEYDAMNLAIEKSTGTHLLFLMDGDELLIVPELLPDKLSIYGALRIDDLSGKNKIVGPSKLRHGLPTSHQSIVFPISDLRYDTKYRIAADYDYYLRHFPLFEERFYKSRLLSIYREGNSAQNWMQRDKEIIEIAKRNRLIGVELIVKAKKSIKRAFS